MQKISLRELKGAPLSIILAIFMAGNRTVSVNYLITETGYSQKTIHDGLLLLKDRQIVTSTGYNCYQLTGENMQLPLYWDEKTEPNPSPASDQPALFEFHEEPQKFSGKKLESGKIPESVKIPELENRISALEKRVFELENRKNSGINAEILPETGKIPSENGEFPYPLLKEEEVNKQNNLINPSSSCDEKSGKIPELTEDDYRQLIKEWNDYFMQHEYGEWKYPEYRRMTDEFITDIIKLHPDPRVLQYLFGRCGDCDVFYGWCQLSFENAKRKLLKKIGIFGHYFDRCIADPNVTLELIDYHYQNWKQNPKDHENYGLGAVGKRICEKWALDAANTSDPLAFNWLDD